MSRASRALLFACTACLLAACAGRPVRPSIPQLPPAEAQARQAARETALASSPRWSLQGRLAVSRGHDGGSGRIEWRQDGARFEVALSAPVTRQSWRLAGGEGEARLEGLAGGTRTGADAAALLEQATGWVIPVDALAAWVRGARAATGPAEVGYGTDGHLATLRQDGWIIRYRDWRPQSPQLELPYWLEADRGDARVRLVIDAWGGADPAAP